MAAAEQGCPREHEAETTVQGTTEMEAEEKAKAALVEAAREVGALVVAVVHLATAKEAPVAVADCLVACSVGKPAVAGWMEALGNSDKRQSRRTDTACSRQHCSQRHRSNPTMA